MALAGLGVASTQVLPAMEEMPGVEIVAGADTRPEARDAFAARYGGRVYASIDELCRDERVDAVWVSTPNQFHCEHTLLACEAGKHVVVEKPMALTLADALRMVDAAAQAGVRLLCGHTQSFNPAIRAMRRVIAGGELGSLISLNTWMATDWLLRPRMPQELDVTLGGGVVYRQGPHQVDIIRLLGGGLLRSVRASIGRAMAERPTPGNYSAFLEFEDGTPATIVYDGYGYFDTSELTAGIGERYYLPEERVSLRQALRRGDRQDSAAKESMRFGGENQGGFAHAPRPSALAGLPGSGRMFGVTVATCERGAVRQAPDGGLLIYEDAGVRRIEVEGENASRTSELRELHDAVIQDRPVYHDGQWGLATLEVCLAMMESARERREVTLAYQRPTPEPLVNSRQS
ncbi:MAG: Gfo/Idh/MocA family oxidoreductase [Chloroflexi bacterium]|nr:Gfo/Idh/MocA family oxidoreductase [Chloroflexota bacterium]